jgi:hypothetical protein
MVWCFLVLATNPPCDCASGGELDVSTTHDRIEMQLLLAASTSILLGSNTWTSRPIHIWIHWHHLAAL